MWARRTKCPSTRILESYSLFSSNPPWKSQNLHSFLVFRSISSSFPSGSWTLIELDIRAHRKDVWKRTLFEVQRSGVEQQEEKLSVVAKERVQFGSVHHLKRHFNGQTIKNVKHTVKVKQRETLKNPTKWIQLHNFIVILPITPQSP